MLRPLLIACVLASGFACVPDAPRQPPGDGSAEDAPEADEPDPCEGVEDVPVTELGRLSPTQYANTLSDLSGGSIVPAALPAQVSRFATELEVEAISNSSRALVTQGLHRPFVPCDSAAPGLDADACVEGFIDAFGLRLFRRPVQQDERETLRSYFRKITEDPAFSPPLSFDERIGALAEVMLSSPQFLYVHDEGAAEADGALRPTTGYERAAKLSLFLFDRAPDEALLKLAAEGALDHDEGLRAVASQMVVDPRSRPVLRRFASSWLGLDATGGSPALEDKAKSLASFPFDSPELRVAMRDEVESLYERVVADGDARFSTLFTTTDARVTPALAELYGAGWANGWTLLDGQQRAGILTRAGFLAQFAGPEVTSPIRRGAQLYRNVLGLPLGNPPPNANLTSPTPGGEALLTTREASAQRTASASCQGCHAFINPLGFSFEHYDAIGRWRDVEMVPTSQGDAIPLAVSAQADQRAPGLEGSDDGAVSLSARIGKSAVAHDAHAARWFRAAIGRESASEDACTLKEIKRRFLESDDLRALLVDVATSAPTRLVRPQQEGEAP